MNKTEIILTGILTVLMKWYSLENDHSKYSIEEKRVNYREIEDIMNLLVETVNDNDDDIKNKYKRERMFPSRNKLRS